MNDVVVVQDPGWGKPLRILWTLLLLPFQFYRRNDSSSRSLVELREIQIAQVLTVVGVTFVVVLLSSLPEEVTKNVLMSPTVATAVVLVVGILSIVVPGLLAPPLDKTGSSALRAMYTRQIFLRIAFAQSVSLIGFVAFIITGTAWVFFVALPFTAYGHMRLAPTQTNIERDQEQLRRDGFDVNLLAVLVGEDGVAS